ncbi:MAG: hypothetical protein SVK54_07660 [candidate division WOR-3 bacterium]|nr:hypothetical protein [candidate division WOR-3 bacterium]
MSIINDICDNIFSRGCIVCGNELFADHIPLCRSCYHNLYFTGTDICGHCGRPAKGSPAECMRCRGLKADMVRGVVKYNRYSGSVIKAFKYSGMMQYGIYMAGLMAEAAAQYSIFEEIDYITYIPFDYFARHNRLYNHSAILASAISEMTGIPVADDLLSSRIKVIPQAKLPSVIRMRRPAIFKPGKGMCSNRNILIIDDVMTTGRTISEASYLLKSIKGAGMVNALVFAIS